MAENANYVFGREMATRETSIKEKGVSTGTSEYEWDLWFNGEVWKLTHNVDFKLTIPKFIDVIRMTARRRNKGVIYENDGTSIYIKAIDKNAGGKRLIDEKPLSKQVLAFHSRHQWDEWLRYDVVRVHGDSRRKINPLSLSQNAARYVLRRYGVLVVIRLHNSLLHDGCLWVDIEVVDRSKASPPLDQSVGQFLEVKPMNGSISNESA